MARKTRRQSKRHASVDEGVMTIPELRRAFEHMEDMIHECHVSGKARDECVKRIRKEWSLTFNKELSKSSAESLLKSHISSHQKKRTRKRGGASLTSLGAPVDHQMRMGGYPDASQGGMRDYYLKGLANTLPQIADAGKVVWPTPGPSMGKNVVMNGGRRGTRRTGGANMGALLSAAFERPVGGSSPPGILYDAQTMMKGQMTGASPSPIYDTAPYRAAFSPKVITY